MMTYYQDATAFIHSGDEEGAEAGSGSALGQNTPRSARQRLLEYGSGSETSSQAESGACRERPTGRSCDQRQSASTSTDSQQQQPASASGNPRPRASVVSSDAGSLNSEQLWEQHPQLVARIRQLNSAKTRLNRLQTLIQAMEAGAGLADLPAELREMAAELLGEDAAEERLATASGRRDLPPALPGSNGRSGDEVEEDDPEVLLSSYKVKKCFTSCYSCFVISNVRVGDKTAAEMQRCSPPFRRRWKSRNESCRS